MATFKALRIFSDDGKTVINRIVDMQVDELDPGEVVVKTRYSSVNFKDGLATDYVTDAVLKSARSKKWEKVKQA